MSEEDTNEHGTPVAQEWGDPEGKGLLARMEERFDPDPVAKEAEDVLGASSLSSEEEVTKEPDKEPEAEPEAKEESDKEEPEKEEGPLIDEDFFSSEEEESEEEEEEAFNEEAFDAQTEKEIEGLDPKQGDAWKALKAELKEYKKGAASPDVQERMQELELKAAEADGLKQKLEALGGKSAQLRVESSDAYARKVIDPASSILKKGDELAKYLEADAAVIRSIIKERDIGRRREAISKHLADVNPLDQAEVNRLSQDFSSVLDTHDSMMANAEKEIEIEDARAIEAERKLLSDQRQAVQTMQKDLWEKYQSVVPGFSDEDGNRTESMEKLMNQGMAIDFSKSRAKDQAYAAFAGVTLPHVMKQVKVLEKRLSDYEKAEGKANRGKAKPSGSIGESPVKDKEPETFMERLANAEFI